MEKVRHDVLGDGAVRTDELLADAQERDIGSFVEPGQNLIHLQDFAALRVDALAAREDVEQQHFCLGQFGVEFVYHGRHAVDHLLGGVAALTGIVCADHHHGDLGADVFYVAVVQSPQDVLGAVATDSEVHGVALGEVPGPDRFAGVLPGVGDGVADEDQVDVALGHALVERGVPLGPPVSITGSGADSGVLWLVFGDRANSKSEHGENRNQGFHRWPQAKGSQVAGKQKKEWLLMPISAFERYGPDKSGAENRTP